MNLFMRKNLPTLMIFLISTTVFTGGMFWTNSAEAHKGHAGKKITFIKKKPVLKALLPAEGKTYRRKQRLDSSQAAWANKTYGVDLKTKVYAYYVSKDKKSNKQIASAIIYKFTYRHGNCELAIGLDKNNTVKTTAFVSVNEKYQVDFEETVGEGFIKTFDGMKIEDLIENAKNKASSDKATREFANALRDAAVTLVAFQQK